MVCLGFKPAAAGWQAQTIPWSYGGRNLILLTQDFCCIKQVCDRYQSTEAAGSYSTISTIEVTQHSVHL